ncbi:MAG: hypothetical protein MRY83_07060 [Flavobacteriales bacterium]|nr:hypothetical protein [Flavobacteriales bacterium]
MNWHNGLLVLPFTFWIFGGFYMKKVKKIGFFYTSLFLSILVLALLFFGIGSFVESNYSDGKPYDFIQVNFTIFMSLYVFWTLWGLLQMLIPMLIYFKRK